MNRLAVKASAARQLFHVLQPLRRSLPSTSLSTFSEIRIPPGSAATIETPMFLSGPIALIAPGLKVCLGPLR
jgi:hypothetical protein